MKICTKCNAEKSVANFSKSSSGKSGLSAHCKACQSEYHRIHYEANKASINARHRAYNEANPQYRVEYYAKNRDRFLSAARENYAENRDSKLEYQKQYYVENPEKVAATRFKRRARLLGAEGSHTAADIKAIFESQRGRCASCEKKLFMTGAKKYHVDHIKPLARGGSNAKENLQCLCPSCNHRKHAKDPFDWAKENGKLL